MARIRTIKPEFWTHEAIMECSMNARLLFIGMWNFADDAGRLKNSPTSLKAQILPSDNLTSRNIHELIMELSVNKRVVLYTVDNTDYIQIRGWDNQKINRPNPSKLPPPPLNNSNTTHGVINEPHPPEGKGREKEGRGREKKEATASETEPFLRAPAHEASTDSAAAEEILEKEKTETKPKNPAVEIITAFDASRVAAFGENQARAWPNQTDLSVAESWHNSGIPISQIIDVFDYGFGRKSSEGAEPPASLKYFDSAVREQHKRQAQSGTTAANGNQSHEAPHKNSELNRWTSRLKGFKSQGFWLEAWGPKPTEKHHEIPIKDHPELGEFIEKLKDKSTRKQPKNDVLTLPEKIVERFVSLGVRHWPDSNKTNNGSQLERQAQEVLKRSGPDLDDRIVELMSGVFDAEFGALTSAGVTDRPASMRGLTNAISCAINDAKGAGSAEDVSDE